METMQYQTQSDIAQSIVALEESLGRKLPTFLSFAEILPDLYETTGLIEIAHDDGVNLMSTNEARQYLYGLCDDSEPFIVIELQA